MIPYLTMEKSRPQRENVKRGKQTKDERHDQFDASLGGALFRALAPPRADQIRVHAQRLGDARAVAVGLHQHRDHRSHVVDRRALRETREGIAARLAVTARPETTGGLQFFFRRLLVEGRV